MNYRCSDCGQTLSVVVDTFRCACGGLLDFSQSVPFSAADVDQQHNSMLRYLRRFPKALQSAVQEITLAEGWTPLIRCPVGLRTQLGDSTWIKCDDRMPSMSFKDRGALLVVALAKTLGAKQLVQDSSGNAGHAVAMYAARAQLPCEIFVPAGTSPSKMALIESYGANLQVVDGSREDTARAALKSASRAGTFYASHVYNPVFYEGTKTYLYEIYEQLGRLPDNLILPVGNGTMFLGAVLAIRELLAGDCITTPPNVIAVQADNCSPIYQSFEAKQSFVTAVVNEGTVAEGIAIADPARGQQILAALREFNGKIVSVAETAIMPMHRRLAQHGMHIELTSAATFAALQQIRNDIDGDVVIPVCGAGIKSLKPLSYQT